MNEELNWLQIATHYFQKSANMSYSHWIVVEKTL